MNYVAREVSNSYGKDLECDLEFSFLGTFLGIVNAAVFFCLSYSILTNAIFLYLRRSFAGYIRIAAHSVLALGVRICGDVGILH
jgi:hypothetical protein